MTMYHFSRANYCVESLLTPSLCEFLVSATTERGDGIVFFLIDRCFSPYSSMSFDSISSGAPGCFPRRAHTITAPDEAHNYMVTVGCCVHSVKYVRVMRGLFAGLHALL